MKVTHVEDHITHAVVTGAQAIDFGISDSPEFFNILSSTLYTDQMLAVVRETLCNAWDAHIEFKCEDTPVDILLDEKYLIIRDYGPGISPKMIGPIYGVYGGSTKASNGQVTGGFGLGCKAPFAYVDDFEVTSHHDGKMTIYRLSKSNAEVNGKPSIVPIVADIPTFEHGLQVKIAIKNTSDFHRFHKLIERIVMNGGMKMNLNGQLLQTLPFNDMRHGFMITKYQTQENKCPITIRYGNVIYPIQREESYANEWDQIINFLRRLHTANRYYGDREVVWSLVLQAAPNTVSVTPSRESLSNQKHTLATVTQLMRDFLTVKDKGLQRECFRLLDEAIERTWLESSPKELFSTNNTIPTLSYSGDGFRSHMSARVKQVTTRVSMTEFSQFVEQYAAVGYPEFDGFNRADRVRRINALIRSGFGGTKGAKILREYRRAYLADKKRPFIYRPAKGSTYNSGDQVESSWFHKSVVAPLIKGMPEVGLKPDRLMVFPEKQSRYRGRELMWPAMSWPAHSINEMWRFARNIVILSFNKIDVNDGVANKHAISKFWLGDAKDCLVYITPRAEAKVEAARKFFLDQGVFLIDLTVNQHQEYVRKQQQIITTPTLKKPKRNGIPVLDAMRDSATRNYNNLAAEGTRGDTIERIKAPKFVIKDGRRNSYDSFDGLKIHETRLILDTYGKDGGLCVNQNQYDRYINSGAIDWRAYILNNLVEEYTTNPRIIEYLAFDPTRLDTGRRDSKYQGCSKWLSIIQSDPDLLEYFELKDNRTEEDKNLMKIAKIFFDNYLGETVLTNQLREIIKNAPISNSLKLLFDRIITSKVIPILDLSSLQRMFVFDYDEFSDPNIKTRVRDFVLFAIEG